MNQDTAHRAAAIVGIGTVLPDAPNLASFWQNIKHGRYSISDVPPDRWDPALYYDPDPKAPEKTYSKIGGWVNESPWEPLKWRLPVPPKVADAMDRTQKWAIAAVREALAHFGYPNRPLDTERTAVILGNAMAGDKHYLTALRIFFPEFADELTRAPSFLALPDNVRQAIVEETHGAVRRRFPAISEDTMPGELANVIAGRIAALFNLRGPNFVCDAACASAMAAITAAIEGLEEHDYDAVLTGGIDGNMSASSYVKFSKIGALSATGTRPYADGADGFVMGEGAVVFLLKRLADAERDGDEIYAVLRGTGGSSDGKGKGITAPNPIGQRLAIERAWKNAGLSPATATLVEGHGTSTRVGDVVEVQSLIDVFGEFDLPPGHIALGSVKSNIGHLKGAAGAAGVLKATMALYDKILPPSLGFARPNPNIDFAHSPFAVNTELRPWQQPGPDGVRRAGVSAFGFGGTNFHAVLEEHIPGRITEESKRKVSISKSESTARAHSMQVGAATSSGPAGLKAPLRGALVIGAESEPAIAERLRTVLTEAKAGRAPAARPPAASDLRAHMRLAIDYLDAADLANKAERGLKALAKNHPGMWKALRGQGVFAGRGQPAKVAFLYTGQGSQYVNMLRDLGQVEPIVADAFAWADQIMTPLLSGTPLTRYLFADADRMQAAEADLKQTAITQPAVLTTDLALTELLAAYGIRPDMVMGHSLGEYGALVAAGAMSFAHALEAVSARGREMTRVSVEDNGAMVAVFAPLTDIERILASIAGYAVVANINSNHQAVVGGVTPTIERATEEFQKAGFRAIPLPVSHAFHTKIVAPASEPLKMQLRRLDLHPPAIPLVANVSGQFYPTGSGAVDEMIDILGRQIASPVQFVKGLHTLYDAGARVFVEVGPKKALTGMAEDVLGERPGVVTLYTNHPKPGGVVSFNQALCGLYAAGLGSGADAGAATNVTSSRPQAVSPPAPAAIEPARPVALAPSGAPHQARKPVQVTPPSLSAGSSRSAGSNGSNRPFAGNGGQYEALGKLFADFLDRGMAIYRGQKPDAWAEKDVVVSGVGLGLPGTERVFDDGNLARILAGDSFIDAVPMAVRRAIVDKRVTRLVKTDGTPRFETIDSAAGVMKLAGRPGAFDLAGEFGVAKERLAALDITTMLAMAAGLEAMRDAGIPLAMHYKTTTVGSKLPERWMLPEPLRDDTGVIFGSAFPGYDNIAADMRDYYSDRSRHQRLAELEHLRARAEMTGDGSMAAEIDRRIHALQAEIERHAYALDRRYVFRILSMGHSQFAEFIGARGPNTQINAACASGTQAVALAQDWIRAGRCRRVVIVTADAVTTDRLLEWIGAGFLASGAAATDELVEDAALPFDRRRHGLILGMGASGMVVESADSVRERGLEPIGEVLGTATANSAFHGSRLDVKHICQIMERLVSDAEERYGVDRRDMAGQTVFVSHETYTPARGGSAQAEVFALREVFGDAADSIVVANTKGYTGHAMGAGVEDAVAVKMLETGVVPPVANFREVDPELGQLNLSRGGSYPIRYALRLGAGFGSQISLSLMRWTPTADGIRRQPHELGYRYRIADPALWQHWLSQVSGHERADVEVAKRTLRIVDQGPPTRAIAAPPARPATIARAAVAQPAAAQPAVAQPTIAQSTVTPASATRPAAPLAPATVQPATPVETTAPPITTKAETEASATDPVAAKVLDIVAGETGYPSDMLDVELDLEADLGIDTVKQAETFAAVRAAYDIPRDDSLQLREFPTLQHVIGWVHQKRPDLAAAAAPAQASAAETASDTGPSGPGEAMDSTVATGQVEAKIGEVEAKVLDIVSSETGYPSDMLDLELDLEADLGIDTVKQAETFAAVREAYDIARDDSLQLREFPTLQHVIGWVYQKRPDLAARAASAASSPTASAPAASLPAQAAPAHTTAAPARADDPVTAKVLEVVAGETGYPPDMLDLDLDLEADLGIDTVKQAETFAAVREAYDIPRDENLQLKEFPTLNHVIQWVYEHRPELAAGGGPAVPAGQPAAQPGGPESAPPPGDDDDGIKTRVVEVVAEQTGYPSDMLELDLDLEADLGIDTVKQAETFAAVRESYGIPRDENLQLKEFPTLNHVIGWVREHRAATASAKDSPGRAGTEAKRPAVPAPVAEKIPAGDMAAAERIPRRVPRPVVRPELDLCKPTGVTLGRASRVIVMLDGDGVGQALLRKLEKLEVDVLALDHEADAESLLARVQEWLDKGPLTGVYWLPALSVEGNLAELDVDTWREGLRIRVKLLYHLTRALYDRLGDGSFVVAATRLGGRHGYDDAGAVAPMGGAVSGFMKTLKRERPDSLIKVVDFPASRKTAALADHLIAETVRDPGAVEIGHADDRRWTIAAVEQPVPEGQDGLVLNSDSVVVVTGAAGSIVSAITADLAHNGGTFYLLDVAPAPDPGDPDLARFASDREGLQRDLFERLKQTETRVTPVMVDKKLAAIERARAAQSAVQAIESAGGTAHYRSVNLTDGAAVAGVIDEVKGAHGRIDVLVHAAGFEVSRLLPTKSAQEFELVFDVKSDGWFHLLDAIGDMPLAATVAFSSIAGRFGNGGQTDYSAANDLLCKYATSFRTTRPNTRALAIDWTAWRDIGMASRGSIPKMMELAGIGMLAPEGGIPIVRRELAAGGPSREILVADALGMLTEEWDPSGGLDTDAVKARANGPMTARISGMGIHSGLVIETELRPDEQPFLHDHQIDGTPVLPGVMGIEAFAEAARILFTDRYIAAVENVNFLAPFKFYRNEPRTVTIRAVFRGDDSESGDVVADCQLIGTRTLATQTEPQVTVHFTAQVRLSAEPAAETSIAAPPGRNGEPTASGTDIYRIYFHGPAYHVLDRVWRHGDVVVGEMPESLPANHRPEDAPTHMEPRLIELCFQTAGVWEIGKTGKLALPQHIDRVTTLRPPRDEPGKLHAMVEEREQGGGFDVRVADQDGNLYVILEGYRTVELGGVDPALRTPLEKAVM
ncbi:MAG: SDR family NAD(P)-dependent oxidoreductase [Proteobacteria bacterium]|nr:SDR family NAD(P)-dependent oxidoreductase [Pseudomonadota bacterium]